MTCPHCGKASGAGARFCGGCGKPLAARCPQCGAESTPDLQFCEACGASLVARPPEDAGARKVVTIVFADLVGSTALHERLDAESARALTERYYRALHAVVEAHGGRVVKLLGDGVMAAFGLPRVAEDDAIRAVRAAVAMQQAFRALAREQRAAVGTIGLRVAVNTGEVVVTAADDDVVGDPINVAARLQDAARDGDVVIGDATRRLVGALVTLTPLGTVALRGRSEQVAAYRVESLERPGGASAVAFVGRQDELARLAAVYQAATAAPAARLAVVLGSPGLGKSRLLDEFTSRLAGATVLTASCEAAGGATFAPIARALRAILGVRAGPGGSDLRAAIDAAVPGGEADRSRITAGIGALLAGTPAAPEETFFVVRRLLAGLAAAQPVVLVLDDLHWAEPLLLDLVEHLVQWSTGVPLLLLAAARPELRDTRSALAAPGRLASDVVLLGGLDAAAATRLAANVIGADALPSAIAGRVLATSEGNPLFLGELVRMLVDDGVLTREGDRWTAGVDLATVEMPPTIRALLAARIERLGAEDRLVLERAAIVGRQFSRTAVAHLLPRAIADLDAHLEALRRSELIEPDATWFLGEPALKFHHGLIRDAAYRRVLKGTRAELHARVADWIEGRVGEAVEHDETIGWHLERAHQNLRELGPLDAQGRALGERASRYLAAAGRRALARDDVPVAADLLGRALARLDTADPARAELALDWCEALLAAGQVGPAADAIAELGRWIGTDVASADRLRGWHTCFAAQRAVLTDPQTLRATADTVAGAAAALAAAGDAAGEAKAHSVHALALARLGRFGACEAALDLALAPARRAHDRRRANAVLAGAPLAALWGPAPVTRASGRCLDVVRVLRITQGAPAVEAVALRCQAVLEALRGRADAAQRMIAASRRMVEELGLTQGLLETEAFAGLIALIEGDTAAAEQSLRAAFEGFRTHGLGIDAARAAALLGIALLAQGRAAEADALSHESEALAGDDLQAAITWRRVRAEALARRGEHAAAVDFARAAVDIAATTDALLHHADARRALAAALRASGAHAEAAAEEAPAVELWEAKGATVLVEGARGVAGAVRHVDRAFEGGGERVSLHIRPRVQPNAAVAHGVRFLDAIAARDADAVAALVADRSEVVDHTTGGTYDWQGLPARLYPLVEAQDATIRIEGLATLGDSLALARQWVSASGARGRTWDVGPFESESVQLIEVDGEGRRARSEIFAANRLGDAVARLYERYAELLPDGPARARAAATARSVAAFLGPPDFDRYATAIGPDVEMVHHRGLVGQGSSRGRDAWLRVFHVILETVADATNRTEDILGLTPEAFLVRWESSGTDRETGGAFETTYLMLAVFGPDGLLARNEYFAPGDEDEALARFDELVAEPVAVRPVQRRVRPNAATAIAARLDAVIAARDADALPGLLADESETLDHTTGTTWDHGGDLRSLRSLLRAAEPTYRHKPLATLGDALALCRATVSASGLAHGKFDVGAYEMDALDLIEVDAHGRHRRTERFAPHRLGDAVARLYERYAELLPDGPARTRSTAIARSAALSLWPYLDRLAEAYAPAMEVVDHRILGTWSARGAEEFLRHVRPVFDLAEDLAIRYEDVLAVQPDAWLVSPIFSGTDRASGGAYEVELLALCTFGADGLMDRIEWFDPDQAAEALARFDELTAARAPAPVVRRRVRANAATANNARLNAAVAARDVDALAVVFADDLKVDDHTTGIVLDQQGASSSYRSLMGARDPKCHHEPLATLGDFLALCRVSVSASGTLGRTFDVGPYEKDEIHLIEVDAQGRRRWGEVFASNHLGDAIVRLYERYAELLPDGPARTRAAATARSAALTLRNDLDSFAETLAPAIEVADHRTLGTWSARGAEEFLRHWRSWFDLVDVAPRDDDVLAAQPDAFLVSRILCGTDRASGGAYEVAFLGLLSFGADGLLTRVEIFDPERAAEALARFDKLTAERVPARPVQRRVRPNAATTNAARFEAAIAARDSDALPALDAEDVEIIDHPTGTTYDGAGLLASRRMLLTFPDLRFRQEPLATLGESLALLRASWSASGFTGWTFDVGAHERELIVLVEVDAQGRVRRNEFFAGDRLGDAIARLYERYAELLPDGPARERAAAMARSVAANVGPFDLDRYAGTFAPAIEVIDHRILGTWSGRGAEAVLQHWRAWLELVAVTVRVDDILGLRPDAFLWRHTFFGTDRAGGGAWEVQTLDLWAFGADGHFTRVEVFDVDRVAEALARFDELVSSSAEVPTTGSRAARIETAATRLVDRLREAWEALDWERVAAAFAPGFRLMDRRRMLRLELDRGAWLENLRFLFEMRSSRFTGQVLATRGDRLALGWVRWEGSHGDVGPSEIEYLVVNEVDDHGDQVALVAFDPDDLDAAYAELDARYAAGEAAPYARSWAWMHRFERAVAARDWEQWTSLLAPDLVLEDHCPLGFGTLPSRDEVKRYDRALLDLRPDARFRLDHVLALDDNRSLVVARWVGDEPAGAFEIPFVGAVAHGPDARPQRFHIYDVDQLDEARACYEKLAATVPPPRIENAATRLRDRFEYAWAAHDWAGIAAIFASGFRLDDRRGHVHLELDRDQELVSLRFRFEMRSSRFTHEVLATRGHRLALVRERFELADGDVGPSDTESLLVAECDERGDCVGLVAFDPDALDAAYAELDARYAAGEAAAHARAPESLGCSERVGAPKP